MRCLYCGKELALLKRLTGGAEFCSDAHRKSYQSEYNDLALSRLLQAKELPEPLPELKGHSPAAPVPAPKPEPKPEVKPAPAPVAAPEPVLAAAAPPPLAAAAKASAATSVEILPAPPEPQPAEIIAAMWGPLIEQPVPAEPEPVALSPVELSVEIAAAPVLPERNIEVQALAREYGLLWANPVSWRPPADPRLGSLEPKQRELEAREFHRGAGTPAVPQREFNTKSDSDPHSSGDSMEIMNQPRRPGPARLWRVPPQWSPSTDTVLGALGSASYPATGFAQDADATVAEPRVQAPPVFPVSAVYAPIALTPEPEPMVEIRVPRVTAPADPVLRPEALTLHAVRAQNNPELHRQQPFSPVAEPPQVPALSALPMRPVMVLGPAEKPAAKPVETAVETPKPAAARTAPKVVDVPVAAARVVRSSSGKRRNDVRVVPAAAVKPTIVAAPPAAPASVADQVESPAPVTHSAVPAVAAPAPEPVQITPPTPEPLAAPVPEPTVRSAGPSRSTLVPSGPMMQASPEVDLRLPEIHLPEVQQSFWERLPSPVKLAIAAALVLTISGFAYFALNSSTASATPTVAKGPSYTVGHQINSGGWIEDWAPNDPLRRVTLLRGSQPFTDYRMEFSAQIQNKAIGWMFRGINPKNFYVVKLEKLKSGLEPEVALVRYAVIDGKNESRQATVLPMKVRVDTTYKIRFDAVGPNFTVWINGQEIERWKDTRLGSGGLGLYSEGEEAAAVHGNVDVFELTSK